MRLWRAWLALSASAAVLLSACAEGTPSAYCFSGSGTSTWRTVMRDSVTEYEVVGIIELGTTGGSTRLTATTADEMSERLHFPLDSVRLSADTLSFRFAPIGFTVSVLCVDGISASGVFARPQPPFDSIRGTVRMERAAVAP